MDARLALVAQRLALPGFLRQAIGIADVEINVVDRRDARGFRGHDHLTARLQDHAVGGRPRGDPHVQGKIAVPEGDAGDARRGRGNRKGVADGRGLLEQRNQHHLARGAAGAAFGQSDQSIDEANLFGRIRLGHDQPGGPGGDHRQHVVQKIRRIEPVDAHGPLEPREPGIAEDVTQCVARRGLAVRGDRVLQVEDERVGQRALGFGEKAFATRRHE